MKQLKFLTNISCEGKPVWYKDHIYEVIGEGVNRQGTSIYKLICEDLQARGIDTTLENKMFKVIELEDKKEEIIEDDLIKDIEIEEKPIEIIPKNSSKNYNKKGKKTNKN